ncbi:MAG: hypothetical protein NC217_02685 [Muribaculaceae bacterium]|nr:hypothetical protein [Muribaculaceae bacterium]
MKFRKPSLHDILVSFAFLGLLVALVFAGKWVWETYHNPTAKVDFERYPVKGIDLSAHNGEVDFDKVAADGISFVWLKASEGETIHNADFAANYDEANEAGLALGAYHFFRFDCDGVKQGVNLCDALDGRIPPLGVAIDVELEHNAKGVSDKEIISRLESMVDYLNLRGLPITFYTNKEGYERFIKNDFADYPLWICSFRDYEPFESDTPWVFWQYSHAGSVQGIKGKVDMNVFNGSRSAFRLLNNDY